MSSKPATDNRRAASHVGLGTLGERAKEVRRLRRAADHAHASGRFRYASRLRRKIYDLTQGMK